MPSPSQNLKFAPRVRVVSPSGDHVFTTHPEDAAALISTGRAKHCGSRRRVAVIELIESIDSQQRRPCSIPSLRQYMGQKYTRVEEIREGDEVVAHVLQFKHIDPRDRALFMLAVTDCMSRARDVTIDGGGPKVSHATRTNGAAQ